MLRIPTIQDKLQHLCGWRQNYDAGNPLDSSLVQSDSGLYFQDAHPLLTLENIRQTMPEDYYKRYLPWDGTTVTYAEGDKARLGEEVYRAKSEIPSGPNNPAPSGDSTHWERWDLLNDFLSDSVSSGISDVVVNFTQTKKLNEETKSLLERKTFFDGAAKLRATIDNKSRLVGFEITPVRALGVTTKINRIGLQMVGGPFDLTLYLFHSSQQEPIWSEVFHFDNAKGMFRWFTPSEDLYLPYIDDDTDAGGSWYLCYRQDELPRTVDVLNVTKDWSKEPCVPCGVDNIAVWRELTKYLQISPFYTSPWPEGSEPVLGDVGKLIYTSTMNYGINCEVTVGCDLTDFIVQQSSIFAVVLQKQVAANLLRMMAMNPDVRVNRNQMNVSRMDILYELDGNPQGRASGLNFELQQAYKALNLETRGLSRACLACNNKGVRFRTA